MTEMTGQRSEGTHEYLKPLDVLYSPDLGEKPTYHNDQKV